MNLSKGLTVSMHMIIRLSSRLLCILLFLPVLTGSLAAQEKEIEAFATAVEREFATLDSVSARTLLKELESEKAPVLLDVRSKEEYQLSHIPNALRLSPDLDSLPEFINQLPRDRDLVVYCSLGKRSGFIGEKLKKAGFRSIANLRGGIFNWANNGFPVSSSTEKVEIHPFNKQWGQYLKKELHPKRYTPVQ